MTVASVSQMHPHRSKVMKIAAGEWRTMSSVLKKPWKDRCFSINQFPVHGIFHYVPPVLVSNLDTRRHVLLSLTYEFDCFNSIIKRALKSKVQVADNVKRKTFEIEKFKMGDKLFQKFYFNHLLKLTFFREDWNSASRVHDREVVHKTLLTKVFHMA
jgi:hypothetical protein